MNCNWIPLEQNKDKVCHFGVGFILALALSIIVSPLVALVAGGVAGVGKELYDEYRYEGFDFFDMFATLAGTTTGIFLYGIVKAFL